MVIKKNIFLSLLFFLLIFALVFYRGPCFLTEGIFEKNAFTFYNYAKVNGIIKGIFYIHPNAYYLKLWTNITNSFGSLFSIETAKIVTTYLTILIYFVIFAFLIYSKSLLFLDLKHKIFAVFVVLLSPPMTPEIWMGSAHVREYFGIFAFILLFYNFENSNFIKKISVNFLVVLSFLSSVWAVALLPAYFARFFFRKSKETFVLFISAFISFLVQFSIILNFYYLNSESTGRFQIEISKIFNFIYNVPVRSFFGSSIPKFLFLESNLYYLKYFELIIYIVSLVLLFFLIIYVYKKKDFELNLISLAFILSSLFAMIGSLYDDFVGGRYSVISGVILIFFILRIYIIENRLIFKYLSSFLLILSLIIGFVEYKHLSPLPMLLNCEHYDVSNYDNVWKNY
tara:strand:- start:5050 stop:6243 length:1194 start_codon:yes stop_codon:yes gene_type:complete